MSLSDELPRAEFLHRLHYATNGVVGNVMNLMRFATLLKQQTDGVQDDGILTLSVMSRAFAKRLHKHLPGKIDPFVVKTDRHFDAPPATLVNAPNSTNRRSKQRKKQEVSASSVLTAS